MIAAILLTHTFGCAALTVPITKRHEVIKEDALHPVIEIIGIWQPAEGQGLDNAPCRGFGGQILFFAANSQSPVQVNGEVTIYVFDDQGSHEDQVKPLNQFHFTNEQWNCLYRESNLGPSYQIFVPYTNKGAHYANCSLRVKYTPKSGQAMYSKVATVTLNGVNKKTSANRPALIDHNDVDSKSNAKASTSPETQQIDALIQSVKHEEVHSLDTFSTSVQSGNTGAQNGPSGSSMDQLRQYLENLNPSEGSIPNQYSLSSVRQLNGHPLEDQPSGETPKVASQYALSNQAQTNAQKTNSTQNVNKTNVSPRARDIFAE
jgi:hypothetical protein